MKKTFLNTLIFPLCLFLFASYPQQVFATLTAQATAEYNAAVLAADNANQFQIQAYNYAVNATVLNDCITSSSNPCFDPYRSSLSAQESAAYDAYQESEAAFIEANQAKVDAKVDRDWTEYYEDQYILYGHSYDLYLAEIFLANTVDHEKEAQNAENKAFDERNKAATALTNAAVIFNAAVTACGTC
jgi:hypothetical protein